MVERKSTTEPAEKSWLTSRRWILVGPSAIVLAALLIYGGTWYRGYRDWHNSKAAPLFSDIEPPDGATVYASDAWIRWSSPTAAKGRVLWRKLGSKRAHSGDAGNGQELIAHLASLNAGSKYEYIAEETDGSQTLRSSIRTLSVKSGLAFDPVIDQTVEHDYDQSVKLTLRNRGSQPVRVAAKALKQFDDLQSDIAGYGSVDVPGQVAPNGALDLRLAVTAADSTHDTYEIPIEAGGAYVTARFHVHIPKLNIAFKVLSEDSKTLAQRVGILNNGDIVTDLSIRPVAQNEADLEIQPGVNHARIGHGEAITITVAPVLYLEFQSLKAEIEAKAAGQSTTFQLEFQAPPGMHLIAFRSASGAGSGCSGKYCTNNPNTCSECGSPRGNGPQRDTAADPPSPEPGGCQPSKCRQDDACQTISDMLGLVKEYGASSICPGPCANFTNKFDPLLHGLRDVDLPCCFNAGADPACASLLQQIHRDRFGLKTLSSSIMFPSQADCFSGTPARCDDYNAIQRIKENLSRLANTLGCVAGKHQPHLACPELETLEAIKTQAERDKKLTHILSDLARRDDPELTKGLEDAENNFETLAAVLGRLIKLGKTCEEIKKILDELQAFFHAIQEINNAGCNSQLEAKGFDDLAKAAAALAGNLPLVKLDPELAGIVDIFAQDKNFFENMSCALNPECRWRKEFQGVDGYVPNCQEAMGSNPQ